VAVMAFDADTELIADFSGDFAAAEKSVCERVLRRGFRCCTPIQAALADVGREFATQPPVVRKPGRGINIHLGPPSSYRYTGMRDIAVRTGGDSIDSNDAAEGLNEMVHRLRMRYSLYYALPQSRPGEVHRLEVQLTREAAAQHPRAIVRARTGYMAPPWTGLLRVEPP
jgi:hypothetical protein